MLRIFGPGLKDGPLPEHYEPLECPVEKHPFSAQLNNPVAAIFKADKDTIKSSDPRVPLCRHHLPGHRTLADGCSHQVAAVAARGRTPDFRRNERAACRVQGYRQRRKSHSRIAKRLSGGRGDRNQAVAVPSSFRETKCIWLACRGISDGFTQAMGVTAPICSLLRWAIPTRVSRNRRHLWSTCGRKGHKPWQVRAFS